jgi:hypothetical protein
MNQGIHHRILGLFVQIWFPSALRGGFNIRSADISTFISIRSESL